ncbi:hypothetical protein BDV95DRAFT_591428 [Massariosphaeria phaeospora]|uniref:Uncharacterized protein n=1 Tax=Massariosphaeria phaeospora TaxID=100035 RepID=A0A7C8IC85_9PLEO|nr:hypothetical protein BDV95DRAFT_591428 [Massariosphaeria phaeospora]
MENDTKKKREKRRGRAGLYRHPRDPRGKLPPFPPASRGRYQGSAAVAATRRGHRAIVKVNLARLATISLANTSFGPTLPYTHTHTCRHRHPHPYQPPTTNHQPQTWRTSTTSVRVAAEIGSVVSPANSTSRRAGTSWSFALSICTSSTRRSMTGSNGGWTSSEIRSCRPHAVGATSSSSS